MIAARLPAMLIALAILSFAFAPPALGDGNIHLDGEALMEACGRPDEAWISFCNGYVQGALDGLEDQVEFCIPESATRAEISGAVYELLRQEPELRELRAASVVGAVAMMLYPC